MTQNTKARVFVPEYGVTRIREQDYYLHGNECVVETAGGKAIITKIASPLEVVMLKEYFNAEVEVEEPAWAKPGSVKIVYSGLPYSGTVIHWNGREVQISNDTPTYGATIHDVREDLTITYMIQMHHKEELFLNRLLKVEKDFAGEKDFARRMIGHLFPLGAEYSVKLHGDVLVSTMGYQTRPAVNRQGDLVYWYAQQ